jgi:hypothetical protein
MNQNGLQNIVPAKGVPLLNLSGAWYIVKESLKTLFTTLIANQQPIRIIVGARETRQSGWVATDIDSLSLLEPQDWERYFAPATITTIMAEHIWEHLAQKRGGKAAQICHKYLQGGKVFVFGSTRWISS